MQANAKERPVRVPLIVIPCLNEVQHIRGVATQMAGAAEAFGGHVVIVDGGSTDGTLPIAEDLSASSKVISLLHNPAKLQSAGLNAAAAAFDTGFTDLIRIDAHCAYPDDYIQTLLDDAEDSGAASVVVGMIAAGDGLLQRVNAATQNAGIGHGGSKHRQRGQGEYVDHGHHALMRLDAFRAVGGYDPGFSHNEDAELDYRLTRAGYRIWLTKRTEVTYFPRRDLPAIARQYYNYGRGRAKNLLKHRMLPKLRQVIACAIAPICALMLLAPLHPIFVLPALLWALTTLAGGVKLALKTRSAEMLLSGPIAMLMHLSWSVGFWRMVIGGRPAPREAVAT